MIEENKTKVQIHSTADFQPKTRKKYRHKLGHAKRTRLHTHTHAQNTKPLSSRGLRTHPNLFTHN